MRKHYQMVDEDGNPASLPPPAPHASHLPHPAQKEYRLMRRVRAHTRQAAAPLPSF